MNKFPHNNGYLKSENGGKRVLFLIALIVGLIAGHSSFLDGSSSGFTDFSPKIKAQLPISHYQNKMLIFIIDFRSFMCPACLESFLEFYRIISPWLEERAVWGVLVVDSQSGLEEEEMTMRIAAKKARGFLSGNALRFPLIVDRFHIFNQVAEKGTAVILWDSGQMVIKKYAFPLAPTQLEEIMNYIQDEK